MGSQGYEEERFKAWFPASQIQEKHSPYSEQDICEISALLQVINEVWSRIPRTYVLLRLLDQLDAITGFIANDITDISFPFMQSGLLDSLKDHKARSEFIECQHLVYNNTALNLERDDTPHGHCRDASQIPLRSFG